MMNDPKWPRQTWTIPYEADGRLEREGHQWVLIFFSGAVRIPIEPHTGERFAAGLCSYYGKEDGIELEREERQ